MINPLISIIIPTYNEAATIGGLLRYLQQNCHPNEIEILVIDGGSMDDTLSIAAANGVQAMVSPQKGRAAQMNFGSSLAKGNLLYFVHADSFPPVSFVKDILLAVQQEFSCGRYQTTFNTNRFIFKINAFFTRFDWFICYGGDQTFFITKKLFEQVNGFNAAMLIMEEYDLTERARQNGRYKIMKGKALVSVRKYEGRSWLMVQLANKKAVALYKAGAPQQQIADTYKQMLG